MARNAISEQVLEIEAGGGSFDDVRQLVSGARGREVYATGDTDAGIWWAGLAQGLIDDVPTVAEMVARIVAEAVRLITGRLGALVTQPTG